jgi:DNA-binding LacI/PurR family transcriptional regulator
VNSPRCSDTADASGGSGLASNDLIRGATLAGRYNSIAEDLWTPSNPSNTAPRPDKNTENPFFFDIYKTVESDAHAAGYEVVVANTDYRSEQLVASIRLMIGRRVAGLAAVVSEMEPALIEELTDSNIPVVFYDVGAPRPNITNIRVNYRRGIDKVID